MTFVSHEKRRHYPEEKFMALWLRAMRRYQPGWRPADPSILWSARP